MNNKSYTTVQQDKVYLNDPATQNYCIDKSPIFFIVLIFIGIFGWGVYVGVKNRDKILNQEREREIDISKLSIGDKINYIKEHLSKCGNEAEQLKIIKMLKESLPN